jgi:hypothetical protein
MFALPANAPCFLYEGISKPISFWKSSRGSLLLQTDNLASPERGGTMIAVAPKGSGTGVYPKHVQSLTAYQKTVEDCLHTIH